MKCRKLQAKVNALESWSGRPDLVLLEVMLPDMSGAEVCRRINADHRLGRGFVLLVSRDGSAAESH